MPRIGGYVADDLWTEVRRARPGAGTSAVLQEALKRLLRTDDPFVAVRPVEGPRMARVVERLKLAANDEYREGYETGLRLLEPRRTAEEIAEIKAKLGPVDLSGQDQPVIDWEMLDMLADDWDVAAWRERLGRRWDADDWDELDEALSYRAADGDPLGGMRSTAFVAGFVAALKEAWSAVNRSAEP